MKLISKLGLLLLVVSLQSSMADVRCATASGDLRLDSWSYTGGPAPFEGMVVGRDTWSYQNTVLGEQLTKYLEQTPEMVLTADLNLGSKVILLNESQPGIQHMIYTIKITLSRKDGTPVLPNNEAKSVTDYFICDYNVNYLIP